ncbi:hypothetical protein Clacol_005179 [Clathrus columnatus]|uniref:Choline/carnitine acyltransferase domain-containing protein n=1 Tax=Clathrus columnatus TaxID=1419009 RepID=A0AAV5A9E4_9AGAM|nr:hypothetical protein Clacol_005179 [Clathrus columnatus]
MASMTTAPENWKSLAPSPPTGTVTFKHQPNLPRLPVPSLSSTLNKLKGSLKAIAWDEEEYRISEKKVDEFGGLGGLGVTLQKRLEERRDEKEHWLEEWWDAGAYNGYRDSVMINVSYYYGFTPHPSKYPQSPAHRAAALTRAAFLFRKQLRQGTLSPDSTKEGPLCMDTWRWMFDCCRVPAPGLDWSVTYAKEGDTGDVGHIIAFRKGRPWRIDVTRDGRILSTEELEKQFEYIYHNTTTDYPAVGALTASDRDTWAKEYNDLIRDPHNTSIMRNIHSSAFVVSLDTECPGEDPVDFSRALWHGGVNGNMFDKPVNFVVFDNTKAGIVGEHSIMDGTPTVRLCDEILDNLISDNFDHGSPLTSVTPTSPEPLDWYLTPEQLTHSIPTAISSGKALLQTQSLNYYLTPYGKSTIKKFKISPDSWTQMIVQLAYFRLCGPKRPGGTYEAATTRKFFKGRTETIRVVTAESEEWVKAMCEDVGVSVRKKRELLRQACEVHIADARDAGKAMGIDRHLLGLKKLIHETEKVPELFSDPVYLRGSRWTLSTSAIWSKHFPVYGWGEVVPDGFGVAYMTGYDDRLQFTITSRKEMPNAEFIKEIAKAAQDMRALFVDEDIEDGSGKSRL